MTSMILHALWLPKGFAAGQSGALAVWGEGNKSTRKRPLMEHPFALRARNIQYALFTFHYYSSLYQTTPQYLTLALPTLNGRPQPSADDLLAAPSGRTSLKRLRKPALPALQPWRVETALLTPETVLGFLQRLPERGFGSIAFGPSLLFWRCAAQLAALALARGQFVPSADDKGRGRWQIALTAAELQTAAAKLSASMPPSARALAQPMPSAEALLEDFTSSVGHTFVSQNYTPGKIPFYDPYNYYSRSRQLIPADQWWLDLFPRKSMYIEGRPTAADQQAFGEVVRGWALPVRHYLASPHRLALRLEPPPTVEAARDTGDLASPDWTLSFHLQPKDQPDLLWAATEVWEAPPHPGMPDTLHAGLSQAAGVYPPLATVLDDPYPTGLKLTIGEAVEFLENHSTELSERGFGVLVPTWWKSRAKLKTKLAFKQEEGSGLFGLNTLVDFDWQLAVGDKTLSYDEFMTLAQSKTSLVQVRGEWMQVDADEVQAALKLVQRHQKSKGKLALRDALGLALSGPTEWEGLEVEAVKVDGWLEDLSQQLTGRQPLKRIPQPQSFVGQLRPYQLNGLSWLNFMRQYGFGACLADDMGLGKTIMLLALLTRDLDENKFTKPVILICPTTVVNNWVREAEKFAPQLKSYAHHGPGRFKKEDFAKAARDNHLVITSYALLPRDAGFINSVEWGGVVLDEAHNVKNPSAKQSQAVRELTASYRVALTGTPVENRLQDLWSIMHFLNPGYLGSAESFQRNFAGPIERAQDARAATRLRTLTGPFILRRLKTDKTIIRDLPPKNEMKEFCGLTKEQAALYRAVTQESLRQIAESDGIRRRGIILATLTKLKQVCNHPRHLLGDQSVLKHRSGKLNRLTEMLEQALAEEDHVLIFTQYAEMGELLYQHLGDTFGSTQFLYGGTPARKRAEMIDRFQNGEARLFVLSLKAGGAGINLTRANRVFHYDRWWNPAVENQATDRAFRIGQTQRVQVHKFICRGTLEERVDDLITRKTALAEQIVGSGEEWLTELTTEELRDLLILRQDAIDD
jgi:SNF2 family DNA or RNA helicase